MMNNAIISREKSTNTSKPLKDTLHVEVYLDSCFGHVVSRVWTSSRKLW